MFPFFVLGSKESYHNFYWTFFFVLFGSKKQLPQFLLFTSYYFSGVKKRATSIYEVEKTLSGGKCLKKRSISMPRITSEERKGRKHESKALLRIERTAQQIGEEQMRNRDRLQMRRAKK